MSPRRSNWISRAFRKVFGPSSRQLPESGAISNQLTRLSMRNEMARILVADNDEGSRKQIGGILRKGQYSFLEFASNPEDARSILDANLADLAILDLRLTNDAIAGDISGLTLAKSTDPLIPKIIVTEYENESVRRKALGVNVEGLPRAIAFLYKGNLAEELLPAVALALEIKKTWFRRTQDEISRRLTGDYDHARRVAQAHTWISFGLAITFAFPVILYVFKLHGQGALTMVFILVGSLGAELTNYVFARKLEFLYQRVDRFHTELLQANKFDQLMALCEEIKEDSEREQFKGRVLEAALGRWIGINESQIQTPPKTG
jgi:CheY-like chemotaxis protein